MPELSNAQQLLRNLQSLLTTRPAVWSALTRLEEYLTSKNCPAVLFGGALRDAMLGHAEVESRDFDVVVASQEFEVIEQDWTGFIERKTRFGGLVLNIHGVKVDLWSLHSTWAFRAKFVFPVSFDNLPATALLSIEAVTLNLDALSTGIPIVHEKNFFSSVFSRIIDINLDVNPFPALSVIRTLVVTQRFDLKITRRLALFLLAQRDRFETSELDSTQVSRYGRVLYPPETVRRTLDALEIALVASDAESLPLAFNPAP